MKRALVHRLQSRIIEQRFYTGDIWLTTRERPRRRIRNGSISTRTMRFGIGPKSSAVVARASKPPLRKLELWRRTLRRNWPEDEVGGPWRNFNRPNLAIRITI